MNELKNLHDSFCEFEKLIHLDDELREHYLYFQLIRIDILIASDYAETNLSRSIQNLHRGIKSLEKLIKDLNDSNLENIAIWLKFHYLPKMKEIIKTLDEKDTEDEYI